MDIEQARRNAGFGKWNKALYRGYVIQRRVKPETRNRKKKFYSYSYRILGRACGCLAGPSTEFDDLQVVFEEIDYLVERERCGC